MYHATPLILSIASCQSKHPASKRKGNILMDCVKSPRSGGLGDVFLRGERREERGESEEERAKSGKVS